MTIYAVAYLASLFMGMWFLWRGGDIVDRLHGLTMFLPIALWFAAVAQPYIDPVYIIGCVWLLHAVTLAFFTDRYLGALMGVVSCGVVMFAGLALLGILPSDLGKGISHNFYHYATLISYLQIATLWIFGLGRFLSRPLP